MSTQLTTIAATGSALYALILDANNNVYKPGTNTFPAPSSTSRADGAIAVPESAMPGLFGLDFPTAIVTPGDYTVLLFQQVSGSPTDGDAHAGDTTVHWNGMALASALPDNASIALLPTAADVADAILFTPSQKLVTRPDGSVNIGNLPLEFLSGTEATELSATVANLNTLLGRTDTATAITSIQDGVNAINAKTVNLPADPASNAAVNTRLAASAYTAPPQDYQQRGQAVTLPAGVAQTSDVQAATTAAQGLAGQNQVTVPSNFDNMGNAQTLTIRMYDSAANTTADDGATGLVKTLTATIAYANGRVVKQTIVEAV